MVFFCFHVDEWHLPASEEVASPLFFTCDVLEKAVHGNDVGSFAFPATGSWRWRVCYWMGPAFGSGVEDIPWTRSSLGRTGEDGPYALILLVDAGFRSTLRPVMINTT
jgi:hypothetical protein